MKYESHCERSLKEFGNEYAEVHRWLDEFYDRYLDLIHRRERHHKQGIMAAEIIFGKDGAIAAVQHIKDDCGKIHDIKDYFWYKGIVDPKDSLIKNILLDEAIET